MANDTLQKKVNAALNVAVFENGYTELVELKDGTAIDVAIDIIEFSPDLENEDLGPVEACVQDYVRWYRASDGTAPRGEE